MPKFRKKTPIVEAMQLTQQNAYECGCFSGIALGITQEADHSITLNTRKGKVNFPKWNWIIKNHFRSYDPVTFSKIYERVE